MERKTVLGKIKQGFLSFPVCRKLISCSDLLLISKGVSQPERVRDTVKRNKMNIKSV